MSKKKNDSTTPVLEEEQVTPEVDTVENLEVPVEEPQPKFATGKVTGCYSLNVREHPNVKANVLCTIPGSAEVQVDVSNSYADWYHVITKSGVDGFCMKKYISVKP